MMAQRETSPKSVFRGDPAPSSSQLLQTETSRISLTRFGNAKWQKKKSPKLITERVGQVNESQKQKSQQMLVLSPH